VKSISDFWFTKVKLPHRNRVDNASADTLPVRS
jgi:hypothetical protein